MLPTTFIMLKVVVESVREEGFILESANDCGE